MKRKKNKIIVYSIMAFLITCVIGGFGMWAYVKWDIKDMIRDVYFADESYVQTSGDGLQGEAEKDVFNTSEDTKESVDSIESAKNNSEPILDNQKLDENERGELQADELGDAQEIDEDEGEESLPEIVTDEKGEMTLVFGGDICFYDPFANMGVYRERGSDIEKCISPNLLKEMREADVCMVNNEFSYSNRGTPLEGKMYTFRSKPENVNILHDMGVDLVSIANNHAYDYGRDAFVDTLQILDDANVKHVGGGNDLEDASKPVFITKNNLTVGFVAATQIERNDSPDTKGATVDSPGVLRCYNQKELDHFIEVINEAKKQCDFLVVYIHWGTENTAEPDWAQPQQAEVISQAGADIIVGCHPHCLQGLTLKNNVPVIYSLGNYWFNSKTVDTALLKIVVRAEGIESLQMIAAQQAGCSTKDLDGAEKERVLRYLQSLSTEVTFDENGYVTW